jgi:hypothetical protein
MLREFVLILLVAEAAAAAILTQFEGLEVRHEDPRQPYEDLKAALEDP